MTQPHKEFLFGNSWAACAKLWGWACAGGVGEYVNFLCLYCSRSPRLVKIQPKLSAAVVLLHMSVCKYRFCAFKTKNLALELNELYNWLIWNLTSDLFLRYEKEEIVFWNQEWDILSGFPAGRILNNYRVFLVLTITDTACVCISMPSFYSVLLVCSWWILI